MRIALCDYCGHPFQIELSRSLARRGHAVLHLYSAEFETPHGSLKGLPNDDDNLAIVPVVTGQIFKKTDFFKRRQVEREVGRRMGMLAGGHLPDVVVVCNMPLETHAMMRRVCRTGRFVFWQQDIYSYAARAYLSAKLGLPGDMIGRYYQRMEGRLLRSSAAVVPISKKFLPPLTRWGVDPTRIHVIPNWAPLSEIFPMPKDNPWAREHDLAGKPVALYTGTLGLKHDPHLLADLAKAGAGIGLHVVVVSQGPAVEWLKEQRIDNLILLPFQPMERYSEVLGTGDVMLAMIGEEAAGFSVPSKILSYLAAGRPIVAAIKDDNDAALVISRAKAGFVVNPGDYDSFKQGVFDFIMDEKMRIACARNAREYASQAFAIRAIADKFADVFAQAAEQEAYPRLTRPIVSAGFN